MSPTVFQWTLEHKPGVLYVFICSWKEMPKLMYVFFYQSIQDSLITALCQQGKCCDKAAAPSCPAPVHTRCEYFVSSLKIKSDNTEDVMTAKQTILSHPSPPFPGRQEGIYFGYSFIVSLLWAFDARAKTKTYSAFQMKALNIASFHILA